MSLSPQEGNIAVWRFKVKVRFIYKHVECLFVTQMHADTQKHTKYDKIY